MKHPLDRQEVYSDPEIHGGQPIIESGIPIYLILDMLAQGFSPGEMQQDYGITPEHARIALRFAADFLKSERSHVTALELPSR